MGSARAGQIDVLFAATVEPAPNADPNTPVQSVLYNRPSLAANFFQPAYVEQVGENTNFSHLNTLQGQNGLSAYWQQNDGVDDDVYVTRRLDSGVWTKPIALSRDSVFSVSPSVAINEEGEYVLAYERQALPILPGSPQAASQGDESEDAVDPQAPPTRGSAFSRSVARLPEISFTIPTHFGFRDNAPVGSEVPLKAEISNSGFIDADVRIEYFVGQPNGQPASQETVRLPAGERHAVAQPTTVAAGATTYCIVATPVRADGTAIPEAHSSEDNVSCTRLEGLPDLATTELWLSDNDAAAGETIQISQRIENRGAETLGPFDVALYLGDPELSSAGAKILAVETVEGLAGFEAITIQFPWVVPDSNHPDYQLTRESGKFGQFVLTGVVDPTNFINEAVEANNDQSVILSVLPDPAIVGGPTNMASTLLSHTGVNNVQLDFRVTNRGVATAENLTLLLSHYLDEQLEFVKPTASIETLGPGETVDVSLVTDGLAGMNRYRVAIGGEEDGYRSNNSVQTTLSVGGLPDLAPGVFKFDTDTPQLGDTLTILANIENLGIDAADAVLVELFTGPGEPANYGELIDSLVLDRIAALDEVVAQLTFDSSDLVVSEHHLCLVVDRHEHISELDDRNNASCQAVLFNKPVNDAPEVSVPGAHETFNDHPTSIEGILFSDRDAKDSDVLVTLEASHGLITVDTEAPEGLASEQVVGNGTGELTITAPIGSINASLAIGLLYQPIAGFIGFDYLTLSVDDLGNTGPGGPMSTEAMVEVKVKPVLPGDLDVDRDVDFQDFLIFSAHFGNQSATPAEGDIDLDGLVGFADFLLLAENFGRRLEDLQ